MGLYPQRAINIEVYEDIANSFKILIVLAYYSDTSRFSHGYDKAFQLDGIRTLVTRLRIKA